MTTDMNLWDNPAILAELGRQVIAIVEKIKEKGKGKENFPPAPLGREKGKPKRNRRRRPRGRARAWGQS